MGLKFDFKGKTALITGATRGIGKAIADDFLAVNANLILTGTNIKQIKELNSRFKNQVEYNVRYIHADFSDLNGIERFINEIKKFERIDICINNAGINQINLVEDTTSEDYQKLMNINLNAPFMICKQLAPIMKEAGYGRIVNIASIWSVITKSKRSLYTTAKAGLVGMTKTLSVELAPFNVLVNAISPGFTMTELTQSTLTKEEIKKISKQIPANRFAQPEEISKVVIFLASDLNSYITGQNVIVDGGFVNV